MIDGDRVSIGLDRLDRLGQKKIKKKNVGVNGREIDWDGIYEL